MFRRQTVGISRRSLRMRTQSLSLKSSFRGNIISSSGPEKLMERMSKFCMKPRLNKRRSRLLLSQRIRTNMLKNWKFRCRLSTKLTKKAVITKIPKAQFWKTKSILSQVLPHGSILTTFTSLKWNIIRNSSMKNHMSRHL